MRGIHPVFHVSMLEPSAPNEFLNRTETPPLPVIIDRETEFEISEILDSKIDKHHKCRLQSNGLVMKVPMKKPPGFPRPNSSTQWSPWRTFTSQTRTSQVLLPLKSLLSLEKPRYFLFFYVHFLYKSPLLTPPTLLLLSPTPQPPLTLQPPVPPPPDSDPSAPPASS